MKPKPIDCGKCTYCCQNTYVVLMEDDKPENYLTDTLGNSKVLKQKKNGDCIYLDRGIGCTKYEHRPEMCRFYNCVDFYNNLIKKKVSMQFVGKEFVTVVKEAINRNKP